MGDELDFHAPSRPNSNYSEFVRSQNEQAAAMLGISYASFTQDLSKANFVSGRFGRLLERKTMERIRAIVVERVAMPVFRRWVQKAYLEGAVPRTEGVMELMDVSFVGEQMEHIQPREAAAADHQRPGGRAVFQAGIDSGERQGPRNGNGGGRA